MQEILKIESGNFFLTIGYILPNTAFVPMLFCVYVATMECQLLDPLT